MIQFDNFEPSYWIPASTYMSALTTTYCGGGAVDMPDKVLGEFYHVARTITLRITPVTTYSSLTTSLGVKDVTILFTNATSYIPEQYCAKYSNYSTPGNCDSPPTTCGTGYYRDSTGTCQTCALNCIDCYGPSTSECYSCKITGGIYYDGTSCSTAPDPNCMFYSQTDLVCSVCMSTYFLYWDGTCLSTCSLAYTITGGLGIYKTCETICQATNTYLLWNNTCTSACIFPLVERIQGLALFCDFGCSSNTLYLYPDGQCSTVCTGVPRIEGSYMFCDYCSRSSFQVTTSAEEQPYYTEKAIICVDACEYPYITYNSYCIIDLPEDERKAAKLASDTIQWSFNTIQVGVVIAALLNYKDPRAVYLGTVVYMFQYIKYLKITYPPRLQYILDLPHIDSLFDLIFIFPPGLESQMSRYTLPERFQKYELHSSFLINFWSSFLTIMIAVVLLTIAASINAVTTGNKFYHRLSIKFQEATLCNYLIALFIPTYCTIALYTSMELRTLHITEGALEILSFCLCLIFNVLVIAFSALLIVIINKLSSVRKKVQPTEWDQGLQDIKKKSQSFEIIFSSFQDTSIFDHCFFAVFAFRLYFFYAVIAYLFDYPLAQIIIIFSVCTCSLLYILIARPCRRTSDLLCYIIEELLFAALNLAVLILGFLDARGILASNVRSVLGDIIIVLSVAMGFFGLVYLAVLIVTGLINAIEFINEVRRKTRVRETKLVPLPNLANPLQKEGTDDPKEAVPLRDLSSAGMARLDTSDIMGLNNEPNSAVNRNPKRKDEGGSRIDLETSKDIIFEDIPLPSASQMIPGSNSGQIQNQLEVIPSHRSQEGQTTPRLGGTGGIRESNMFEQNVFVQDQMENEMPDQEVWSRPKLVKGPRLGSREDLKVSLSAIKPNLQSG